MCIIYVYIYILKHDGVIGSQDVTDRYRGPNFKHNIKPIDGYNLVGNPTIKSQLGTYIIICS